MSLLIRGTVQGRKEKMASIIYQNLVSRKPTFHYYGMVVERDGWIVLQYWYFYMYNNWRTSFFGVNDHEGDWEMVSIYLGKDDKKKLSP